MNMALQMGKLLGLRVLRPKTRQRVLRIKSEHFLGRILLKIQEKKAKELRFLMSLPVQKILEGVISLIFRI